MTNGLVQHVAVHQYTVRMCGAPGLVERVFAVHTGSRGFETHQRHMPDDFFRPNRPGYPHPVCSELENSSIRVTVDDCSVTEYRRRGHGSVPLGHSKNVYDGLRVKSEDYCSD